MKKLFVALLITTALTAQASSRDRSTEEPANEDHWKNDAPFPKLQYGQKLCMSNIPPGDPFYNECRACEKKGGSACGGDLRDRMRRSPYGDSDALVVTSIAFNNENAAVIISKSSREKAVKEALEACRAGGKFICEDKVDFVLVHSWRPGKKNAPLDANRNACFYFARSKESVNVGGYWLAQAPSQKEANELCSVDKWGKRHVCVSLGGMCTGK